MIRSFVLAIHLTPNQYFYKLTLTNRCKWRPGSKHNKNTESYPSEPKKLSKWVPKIVPKSVKSDSRLRRVLPAAPMVPHDGPGCQNGAPGLPDDRFWVPEMTESVSKFTTMPERDDLETNIQEPASQHTYQQRKNDQEANIQKPAARGPAAVGEAHKIRRTSVRGSRAC